MTDQSTPPWAYTPECLQPEVVNGATETRPVALLIAPWRGISEKMKGRIEGSLFWLLKAGYSPIFYPFVLEHLLSDGHTEGRQRALDASKSVVKALALGGAHCFALRGRVSEGMLLDEKAWRAATDQPIWEAPETESEAKVAEGRRTA